MMTDKEIIIEELETRIDDWKFVEGTDDSDTQRIRILQEHVERLKKEDK